MTKHSSHNFSSPSQPKYIGILIPLLLCITIAITEMATEIYAPSMALVANYFRVTESQIQGTISVYLTGMALSGIIYGPLSDCYGRKLTLSSGTVIFLLGSLGCLLATSFGWLIFFRLVQGIGAGVSLVLAYAIILDIYNEKQSAIALSYVGIVISLAPAMAPVLGGILAHNYGWRMCFSVVSISAIVILISILIALPETLPKDKRIKYSFMGLLHGYLDAIKNLPFIRAAMVPACMMSADWAWLTSAPILFINYLNVPLNYYGYYNFISVFAFVVGIFLNSFLVNKHSLKTLLLGGIILCLSSSVLLLTVGYIEIKNAALTP